MLQILCNRQASYLNSITLCLIVDGSCAYSKHDCNLGITKSLVSQESHPICSDVLSTLMLAYGMWIVYRWNYSSAFLSGFCGRKELLDSCFQRLKPFHVILRWKSLIQHSYGCQELLTGTLYGSTVGALMNNTTAT